MTRRAPVLVAALLACAACSHNPTTSAPQQPSPDLSGRWAGDVISAQPFPAPSGAFARKILYVSTGLAGQNIAVSGIVIVPRAKPPPGGRPIAAWAHPTTGVATGCAPSARSDALETIPGLTQLLDDGYIVAATDYPGLGTVGPHPYLVGISEARAVIDSVRAARHLAGAHASSAFAVWGHSQGGHAALFVGQLAATYAPELRLKGVAAIAPATDLARQFRDNLYAVGGRLLGSYAVWSWAHVYDARLGSVVSAADLTVVDRVAGICIQTNPQFVRVSLVLKRLSRDWLRKDIFDRKPWSTFFAENTPGLQPAGEPMYVAQGSDDGLIGPAVTAGFAADLCRHGVVVDFIRLQGVEHHPAGMASGARVAQWLADRLQGRPAPSTCSASTAPSSP